MLTLGTPAPDFSLPDQHGRQLNLRDLRGRWVVLWWYPRASSETCSVEAARFAAAQPELVDLGAAIVGIGFGTIADNLTFAECEGEDLTLLADADKAVGTAYDVVRAPDEPFADAPRRVTYLIDPDGVVRRAYAVGDVVEHVQAVISDLSELSANHAQ